MVGRREIRRLLGANDQSSLRANFRVHNFGIDVIERRGKLPGKAQPLALLGPGKRQVTDTRDPGRCQLDGLVTFEDGLDDVGGEERQG